MVDTFLVLMLAGAGDELQGIKKGILEVADLLAINKADGDNKTAAERARREYKNAIHLFSAHDATWVPPVKTCSALTGEGVQGVWDTVLDHRRITTETGQFDQRRADQQRHWLWDIVSQEWMARFKERTASRVHDIEALVMQGQLTPTSGALTLLDLADEEHT